MLYIPTVNVNVNVNVDVLINPTICSLHNVMVMQGLGESCLQNIISLITGTFVLYLYPLWT